jgi:hypothetical protein
MCPSIFDLYFLDGIHCVPDSPHFGENDDVREHAMRIAAKSTAAAIFAFLLPFVVSSGASLSTRKRPLSNVALRWENRLIRRAEGAAAITTVASPGRAPLYSHV